MSRGALYRIILSVVLLALIAIAASCSLPGLLAGAQATATPTRTPRPVAPSATLPPALAANLALPTQAPAATAVPSPTVAPAAEPPTATAVPPTVTSVPPSPTLAPPTATVARPTSVPATAVPPAPTATPRPAAPPAPSVDFVISELRVLGQGENNGGIEGPGAGRTIYINVIDAAGNPIDGAAIVNTAPYPSKALSGDKGPGKAEILMDREEFRLKIESVNGQPVSSEVSHNISLIAPVPQDIAGKLGDTCRTLDNCPIPPYKHFSYIVTFRKTR